MTLPPSGPTVRTPPNARARLGAPSARGHGETRAGTDRASQDQTDAAAQANDHAGSGSRTARRSHRRGALDRPRDPLPTRVQDLPPLPDAFHVVLRDGLRTLELDLTPAALGAIDVHVRLLLAWTAAINLTAIRAPDDIARVHVLDSVAAVPELRRRGVTRLLDLGSGGGFPGIPLAAALEADRALLVDSVGKKVRFMETVIGAAGLGRRVAAEVARAEALGRDPRDREAWPAVTARAVAGLSELVEVGLPLVAPGGVLVAWKGATANAEVDAAAGALRALRAGAVTILDAGVPGLDGHRLVIVERGGPIDPHFPRDPAERRRQPL